jgi:hypothetical protein
MAHVSTAAEPLTFDEFVDLLRVRLGAADALNISEAHDFKTLMEDYAEVTPDNWWWDAFDELEAQGHLDPRASGKTFGVGNVHARLSADGRLYLRTEE